MDADMNMNTDMKYGLAHDFYILKWIKIYMVLLIISFKYKYEYKHKFDVCKF